MSVWRPNPSPFRYIVAATLVLSLALAAWLWSLLSAGVSQEVFDARIFLLGCALFLCMVLIGLLCYLLWCILSMKYSLTQHALTLACGGVRQVVPLSSITAIYEPGRMVGQRVVSVRWKGAAELAWGYLVGEGRSRELGRVVSVATQPAAKQVFVVTTGVTFGLSPANPRDFVKRLNGRLDLNGDGKEEDPHTELKGLSAWGAGLWKDRTARSLLLAGLVSCVALFGYLSLVFGNLPPNLALHWNAFAQVDRIGSPLELLRLPVFGLLVWLANSLAGWWALPRERMATLFLLAGAVASQVVFAAGVLSIVLRT